MADFCGQIQMVEKRLHAVVEVVASEEQAVLEFEQKRLGRRPAVW